MNPQETVPLARSAEFYQTHLDRVSRSFALGIRQLEAPVREWIGLSYLLCRVLDTIEDSAWSDRARQAESFAQFRHFIEARPIVAETKTWRQNFTSEGVSEGERALLDDAHLLFSDLHDLEPTIYAIVSDGVLSMSRGMEHFALRESPGTRLKLRNCVETDQYCFFVAGVVGELLTRLIFEQESLTKVDELLPEAFHFGLFLQKINLLKDQREDSVQGRFLVTDRERLRASVERHAWHALHYLETLPLELCSYRIFCAWALFLGLASLKWIDQAWRDQSTPKMPRARALLLMERLKRKIGDNEALRAEALEYLAPASATTGAAAVTVGAGAPAVTGEETHNAVIEPWFRKAYRGALSSEQLLSLGVVAHAT